MIQAQHLAPSNLLPCQPASCHRSYTPRLHLKLWPLFLLIIYIAVFLCNKGLNIHA